MLAARPASAATRRHPARERDSDDVLAHLTVLSHRTRARPRRLSTRQTQRHPVGDRPPHERTNPVRVQIERARPSGRLVRHPTRIGRGPASASTHDDDHALLKADDQDRTFSRIHLVRCPRLDTVVARLIDMSPSLAGVEVRRRARVLEVDGDLAHYETEMRRFMAYVGSSQRPLVAHGTDRHNGGNADLAQQCPAGTVVLPVLRRSHTHGVGHRRKIRPVSCQTVSTEARRLLAAGIIQWNVVGRNKVLAVVDDHPAINALRTLVDLTVGPLVSLKRLYDVDGVEHVWVFGSWARRHLGEPGPTPRDIDVLVVGTPDEYGVTSVCLDLSGQYGIEVNPMIVSNGEFTARGRNQILDQITTGPLVEVRQ